MKAKELIKQLKTVHPDCEIVMADPDPKFDENVEVGGILVTGNDDGTATEATILNKADHDEVFGNKGN